MNDHEMLEQKYILTFFREVNSLKLYISHLDYTQCNLESCGQCKLVKLHMTHWKQIWKTKQEAKLAMPSDQCQSLSYSYHQGQKSLDPPSLFCLAPSIHLKY